MPGRAVTGPGSLRIREAEPRDAPVVYGFIEALARFEGLLPELRATERDIHDAMFVRGELRALIAWVETGAAGSREAESFGEVPAGFVVYYPLFSTFRGRRGLYAEDLFVDERFRGMGIAHELFRALAELGRRDGAFCLQWAVLDWNDRAKSFYRSLGGAPLAGWELWRKELQ